MGEELNYLVQRHLFREIIDLVVDELELSVGDVRRKVS